MNLKKKLRKGQTMVEYIIIVCLIAISLIAVFTYLGKAIGRKGAAAAKAIDTTEGEKAEAAVEAIDDPDDPQNLRDMN